MYDEAQYPSVSSVHKTSVAEIRHSLNKPLQNHVAYMSQKRFTMHFQSYGALSILNVMQKYELQADDAKAALKVYHRPSPSFPLRYLFAL